MAFPWVVGLAACAPDPAGDTGTAPTEIVVDVAPCGFAEPPSITVDVSIVSDIFHAEPFGRIEGRLQETPSPSFHRVVSEVGACRYLEQFTGVCDPACVGGEVCTAEGTCAAFPAGISGGTLTLAGLGDPIELEAAGYAPGTYNGPAGLGGDLFAEGDPIGARTSGGDLEALAFGALGVASMDVTLVTTGLQLVDGADATITWTPGAGDACIAVVLNGFNVTHGAPLDDIVQCEGPDSGSMVIPRELVERFPLGATPQVTEGFDWPHSTLTRYTASRSDTSVGAAALTVRSTATFLLGHTER